MSDSKEQPSDNIGLGSPHCYAVDDPVAVFSHVAFVWEDATESWRFLCAGRTDSEFRSRVNHWVSKGCEPAQVREYAVQAFQA